MLKSTIERRYCVNNKLLVAFLASFAFLIVSAPLSAHHGNAAYDMSKEVTMTGVVTDWIVANPHSFLKFDVTDDKGNVVHWLAESGAPNASLPRLRLGKDALKAGDKITITLIAAKNGQPVGRFHKLVLPDGRIVQTDLP